MRRPSTHPPQIGSPAPQVFLTAAMRCLSINLKFPSGLVVPGGHPLVSIGPNGVEKTPSGVTLAQQSDGERVAALRGSAPHDDMQTTCSTQCRRYTTPLLDRRCERLLRCGKSTPIQLSNFPSDRQLRASNGFDALCRHRSSMQRAQPITRRHHRLRGQIAIERSAPSVPHLPRLRRIAGLSTPADPGCGYVGHGRHPETFTQPVETGGRECERRDRAV
jgi:hypothetical protein